MAYAPNSVKAPGTPVPFHTRLEEAKEAMLAGDFDTSYNIAKDVLKQSGLPIAQQVAAHIIIGTSTTGQFAIDNYHEACRKAQYLSPERYQSFLQRGKQLIDGVKGEMDTKTVGKDGEQKLSEVAAGLGLAMGGNKGEVRSPLNCLLNSNTNAIAD